MAKKKSDSEIIAQTKKLKKSGLINIDLRKVTEKSLSDKKVRGSLLRTLNRYKDVVEDKAAAFKVRDKESREALASRGHRMAKNGLVIIERKPNETIKVTRKGNITYSRPVKNKKTKKEMIEVIYEPNINLKDVHTLEDAVKVYADQYSKKKSSTQFAFTYYGNLSRETFATVEEAMLKVISYVQNQNDIGTSLNPADVGEIMKAAQLLTYIEADPGARPNKVINDIKDSKREFNTYFKKLSKKRK